MNWLYVTWAGLAFIIIGVAWPLIEIAARSGSYPEFAKANGYVLALALSGTVMFWIGRWKLVRDSAERELGGRFRGLWTTVVCTSAVLLINSLAGFLTLQIQPGEIIMFYASIAIAEEMTYRVLLVNAVMAMVAARNKVTGWLFIILIVGVLIVSGLIADVTARSICALVAAMIYLLFMLVVPRSEKSSITAGIVAAVISGVVFSVAHATVYGNEPILMIAMFASGLVMAIFYVYTRNPVVPITAHFINNVMSMQGILLNAVLVI